MKESRKMLSVRLREEYIEIASKIQKEHLRFRLHDILELGIYLLNNSDKELVIDAISKCLK